MSNFNKLHVELSVNNVFGSAPESTLAREYLDAQDFSINTLKAVVQDLRKFAVWFSTANNEPFKINRVTTRDISDFKDCLRRQQRLAGQIRRRRQTIRYPRLPAMSDGIPLTRRAWREHPAVGL
jgi:hypothetical protein